MNKRVIVFNHNHIGDVLLTTPLLYFLYRLYNINIDVVVSQYAKPILESFDYINIIERQRVISKGYMSFVKDNIFKYDMAVLAKSDTRYTLMARFVAKRCIAKRKELSPLLCKTIKSVDGYATYEYLAMMEAIAKDEVLKIFDNQDPLKPILSIKGYISPHIKDITKSPFVVIHPFATRQTKEWPFKNYASVISYIKDRGYNIVVVGKDKEKKASSILKGKYIYNLINKTTLNELIYIIQRASLLITTDSAPLHIAYAVDTKTIPIFLSSDNKKYCPPAFEPLIPNIKCFPCNRNTCKKNICKNSIKPTDVIRYIDNIL